MRKSVSLLGAVSLFALTACSDHYHGMGHMDHMAHEKNMAQTMFSKIDTNGDGVISRKEHEVFSRNMFKEADTNHDGSLTFDEFWSEHLRMKESMKSEMHNRTNDGMARDERSDSEMSPSAGNRSTTDNNRDNY